MKDLEKCICKIQDEIRSNIYDINEGGCIQFAYYLSKQLVKYKVDHKIVFVDWYKINLPYDEFRAVSHVGVFIPEMGYIDGENTFDLREEFDRATYFRHIKPNLRRLNIYRKNYSWNCMYKKTQNKELAKIIKTAFKDANK